MRIWVICFTGRGCALACALAGVLGADGDEVRVCGCGSHVDSATSNCYEWQKASEQPPVTVTGGRSLQAWTQQAFAQAEALLFVSACGIAVRAIAPFVRDKFCDPAVVCVDETGSFAVPLLSGHVGGANELARRVARACGAQAVVTTATDVNGVFAVDEWAAHQGLAVLDRDVAKEVSAALLAGEPVGFASEVPVEGTLPAGLVASDDDATPDEMPALGVSVSANVGRRPFVRTLRLMPRTTVVGVGCKRGTAAQDIAALVDACLEEAHVPPQAVRALATIDLKADEPGVRALVRERGWDLRLYSAQQLAAVPGTFSASAFVRQTVGVDNVCERAACADGGSLLLSKRAAHGVTVALATEAVRMAFDERDGHDKGGDAL